MVGAGPGGLTAAYEAARLGHRVTLFEQEKDLGDQIRFARIPPYKKIYGEWIDWQIDQVKKSKVTIKNGMTVTESLLRENRPDFVILAAGGEKIIPPIPGSDKAFVCDAWQILSGQVKRNRERMSWWSAAV